MLKRNKGFTLFEMLVVLAIVALIAVLILVRYREGQKLYELTQASQFLDLDIRDVQSRAISGAAVSGVSLSGYGLYIQSNSSYTLFYNLKGDSLNVHNGASVNIKTVTLPKSVSITSVKIDTVEVGVGKSIFYIPPSPDAIIEGSGNNVTIDIVLTGQSGSQRTVTVNRYNVIEGN